MMPSRSLAHWPLLLAGFAVVALGVCAPTPWVGVGFLMVWGLFYAVGGLLLPALSEEAAQGDRVAWVVVASGVGVSLATLMWTASAYITKHLWLGSILLLALGLAGAFLRKTSHARVLSLARERTIALVLCIPFLFGCYIVGINEVEWAGELLFTFRSDLSSHTYVASLVREAGLPLVGATGSLEAPYHNVSHTGLSCLLAGIEQITQTTLYQAGRILGIGSFGLLSLSSYFLAVRCGLRDALCVVIALVPLVWGGITFPIEALRGNLEGIVDPYMKGLVRMAVPSGSMYHNRTQLVCVALGAVGLVGFAKRESSFRWLLGAAIALGACTLVKPSLTIVLGPAMTIVLVWSRTPLRSLAAFLAILLGFCSVYLLPKLLVNTGSRAPWSVDFWRLLDASSWLDKVVLLGVLGPLLAAWAFQVVRGATPRDRIIDTVCIALLGALAFAGVFSEVGKGKHGNQSWPLTGSLILAAPLAVTQVFKLWERSRGSRWWHTLLANAAVLCVLLQVLSCAIYAVNYPFIRVTKVQPSQRDELLLLEAELGSRARVLAELESPPLYAYLARPAPWFNVQDARANVDTQVWQALLQTGAISAEARRLIESRDAVVLAPETGWLRGALQRLGWEHTAGTGHYELWVPGNRVR